MRTLTGAEARDRAGLLTVTSYDVDVDLTAGDETFATTTVVRFRSLPGSTFLELDAELVEGTLDGRSLVADGARIPLDGLGGEHEVRVVSRGTYTRTGEGLHRFVDPADGRVYLYLQAFLDDAQRVFACFDQPDLKAVYRLSVTAAPGDVVRSGTRGELRDGVHVFAQTAPLSTYMLTLAAGPWHGESQQDGPLELGVWCRQSLADQLEPTELLRITRQAMAFQQAEFGSAYPFGDTYDQVFVPEFNVGAMENPGMVTYSDESLLFRSRTTQGARRHRAEVMAHELSHMWFGNLVTTRWWDGIWLNEAFATFMGKHTVDSALDWDGTWTEFCLGDKARGYRDDQRPTTHPVHAEVPDSRAALLNFDGISYEKGCSVLRQLVAFVGQDTFFTGLRAYLAEHARGSTDLSDLLAALEKASGRDLQSWAQDWLRTSGVDTLRPVWDGDLLVVEQTGALLRDHVIRVGAYDDTGDALVLRESRPVEIRGARTEVPGMTPADLVLVNDGDLTFAKLRFDDRSQATVLAGIGRLEDPLARALCWGALWDATRDGELPARDYIAAVLTGFGVEDDPSVVAGLLSGAQTAASSYASEAEQAELLERIATACWDAPVEPRSDLQLVLLRAAVNATTDDVRLRALLSGEVSGGVALDAELRWHVVRRMAVRGLLGEPELAVELGRDDTASGRLQWEAALASRPDAEGKAHTWQALTVGNPTNAQVKAMGSAFWQPGQDELLAPWVDAYLEQVVGWWSGGSVQLSASRTRELFPSTLVRQDVLDRVEVLLGREDLPAGLRRIVLEGADDLARGVRAQAAARRAQAG